MIEWQHPALSVSRQCALLGLHRGTLYYEPRPVDPLNLKLMHAIDEVYTGHPYFGSPRMTVWLRRLGYEVNYKRVERLMREMGVQGLYPGKKQDLSAPGHTVYPYLLRDVEVVRPNQVWSSDITYLRMSQGFLYLVAVMDWFSRKALSWELSNSLDAGFCVTALEGALLEYGQPDVFNTDQGSQFGSEAFTRRRSRCAA